MLAMAWQTLRGHKAGLIGAFIAVFCGAAVITACGVLVDSGLRAGIPPERYAGAAVVVGASQSLTVKQDIAPPFSERVPLPANEIDRIARVPGVRTAVGDVSVPVDLGGQTASGHGWSSAVLGPFTLASGRAPENADEVVLDAGLAARAHLAPGATVTLLVDAVPARYHVVGVTTAAMSRQAAVFFTDQQARQATGRPDSVDTVGVLAAPGVDAGQLAEKISQNVPGVVTYTGNSRADAEFLDVSQARSFLTEMSSAFGGSMVMIVLFVVAATLGLATTQRRREFALLRAIAATPGQIHRLIGAETLLLSLIAAVLGTLPGYALTYLLRGWFAAAGAIPADFGFAIDPLPAVAAVLLCAISAQLAGLIVSRKAARISPIDALGEAAVEPARLGRVRLIIGWALVPLAVAAALGVPLLVPGTVGAAGGAGSALLLVVAVALLGPKLLSGFSRVLGLVRFGGVGSFLAAANTQANARRLSAATTPLILGVTMAAVQLFTLSTTTAAAQHQASTGVVADYVLAGSVPPAVADSVRKVPGVTAATPVSRTQVLVTYRMGGEPETDSFAAQGITPDQVDQVLNLDVRQGSLAGLTGNTVALSRTLAATAGVGLGGTVDLHLGDGTAITPRVVAIYGSGLGFGDVTLPNDVVLNHITSKLDSTVLLKTGPGFDPGALRTALAGYPTVQVANRAAFTAAQNTELGAQSTVNLILDGVVLAYIAIAVANTLIMATAARTREFALLRLVGANRRQVRAMMRGEARTIIVTAVVVGSLAAVPPLAGISFGLTGSLLPDVPLWSYLAIVAGAVLLGWCFITVPTRLAMRPKPIIAISVRE